MLSSRNVLSHAKPGSPCEVSKTYVAAPGTGVHQVDPVSSGWNVLYAWGGASTGGPGVPGPTPVTVKLRGADHAPCSNAPLTAWTRQKYVPFVRPLTTSLVAGL